MSGWNYNAYLSDDGEYLTVGYYGNNLLDLDVTPETPMLTFYRRGVVVRSVPLKELLEVKNLRRTVSHFAWGVYSGYVETHRFAVETVEDRDLVFDVTTGRLLTNLPSQTRRPTPAPGSAPRPSR